MLEYKLIITRKLLLIERFARSRIRTCEPEGRRLKRRGIDQLTDSR